MIFVQQSQVLNLHLAHRVQGGFSNQFFFFFFWGGGGGASKKGVSYRPSNMVIEFFSLLGETKECPNQKRKSIVQHSITSFH